MQDKDLSSTACNNIVVLSALVRSAEHCDQQCKHMYCKLREYGLL